MGLLQKALVEIEAGSPPKGPGLFAKALKARSSEPGLEAGPAPITEDDTLADFDVEPVLESEPEPESQELPLEASYLAQPDWPASLAPSEAEPFALEAEPVSSSIEEPEAEPLTETEAFEPEAFEAIDFEPDSFEPPHLEIPETFPGDVDQGEAEPVIAEPVEPVSAEAKPEEAEPLAAEPIEAKEKHAFPFSEAELAELKNEIERLDPTNDAVFAAYSRISEALPLAAFGLLSVAKRAMVLCSSASLILPHVAGLDLDRDAFAAAGGGQPLPADILEALPLRHGAEETGIVRASIASGPRDRFHAIWLFADSRLDGDEATIAALDSLFASAPAPVCEPEAMEAISPGLAALRIPLGTGRATFIRFDLEAFLARSGQLLAGLRKDALVGTIANGIQAMLGQEGRLFHLEGDRLAIALFSKESADAELVLVQFSKSLRKAFPFLHGSGFPEGKALSVDLASSGALEAFERFVSD